jgi:ribosome maturation protein SDO1
MSRPITQPINQVKLTNVAVVRYNKGGHRFEIACYRNKVMDYRAGLETDLSEVLQSDRIFTNVSKGQFAKSSELEKVFGTTNQEDIARTILEKGDSLQVSDLERQQHMQNTLSQIATWISQHCVHPESQRPYTFAHVKTLLSQKYTLQPHKPIKVQYLDAVKFLKTVVPIERARMEVALRYSEKQKESVESELKELSEPPVVVKETLEEAASTVGVSAEPKTDAPARMWQTVLQIDPSDYRRLDLLFSPTQMPGARLDILQHAVFREGDVDLEVEVERKKEIQQQTTQMQSSGASASVKASEKDKKKSGKNDSDDDMDPEVAALASKLNQVRMKVKGKDGGHVNDDESGSESESDGEDPAVVIKTSKSKSKDEDDSAGSDSEGSSGSDDFVAASRGKSKKQTKKQKKRMEKARRKKKQQRVFDSEGEESGDNDDGNGKNNEKEGGGSKNNKNESSLNAGEPTIPNSAAHAAESSSEQPAANSSSGGQSCNTCGGSFATPALYRAHFRSDWHRFNQKLKVKGLAPVSEQEFLLCDAESFFSTAD